MVRFGSRRDLRRKAEAAFGRPFTEVEWNECKPKTEPDYDLADLREVLELARTRYTSELLGVDQLLRALGIDSGPRLLADYLMAIAAVDELKTLNGSGPMMTDEEFAVIGRVLMVCVWASLLATPRQMKVDDVLTGAFGAQASSFLAPLTHDAVSTLARSARAGASSGWRLNLTLYWVDASIDRELRESLTMDLLAGKLVAERLAGLTGRGNVPLVSAEERWQVYERDHARRVGKSYKTAAAYKKAVYRARKRLDTFVASHHDA